MSSDRYYSSSSQIAWVCKALMEGRTINHRMEIREVRGWRLGAIVHRLKRDYAWPIETEYRGPENIANYSLKAGIDLAGLHLPPLAQWLREPEGAE